MRLETVFQDIRSSIRIIIKNPTITVVVILTLALGIGANTAIFSVLNAAFLVAPPYNRPERIVHISDRTQSGIRDGITVREFLFWVENSKTFERAALCGRFFGYHSLFAEHETDPIYVTSLYVSRDLLGVLGVAPVLGRDFTSDEDRPGGPQTALLSFRLWRNKFGGDPQIIGRRIRLGGEDYTIVGILPNKLDPTLTADLWLPLRATSDQADQGYNYSMTARLRAGISSEQAGAETATLLQEFHRELGNDASSVMSIAVVPYQKWLSRPIRLDLLVLLGAVVCILLIAAANVANLLLARTTDRESEMALRVALGAGRARIIRQLLSESILLTLLAGTASLLMARGVLVALLRLCPPDSDLLMFTDEIKLDGRVFAFALLTAIVVGVAVGLAPALRVSKLHFQNTIRSGIRSRWETSHFWGYNPLIIAEVMLSVILLVGAGLLLRSLTNLRAVDLGFNPEHSWTFVVSPPLSRYSTTSQLWNFEQQTLEGIQNTPGVTAAGVTILSIPPQAGMNYPIAVAGLPADDTEYRIVSPSYFTALGSTVTSGRPFAEHETTPIAIVNDAFAKKYFHKGSPLGQQIWVGKGMEADSNPTTKGLEETSPRMIVGTVEDTLELGLDKPAPPTVFTPISQSTDQFTKFVGQFSSLVFVVRSTRELEIRSVAAVVSGVDPTVPMTGLRSVGSVIDEVISPARFYTALLGAFAAVGLALAAIGLYGVISYSVARRTREIGVRVALGASRWDIIRIIVVQAVRMTIIGVLVGAVGALMLTRLLSNRLFGVHSTDPVTFVGISGLLLVTAVVASYIPCRRALRVDPMIALRYE